MEHLLHALHIRGNILYHQGNYKAAREVFAKAVSYADDPRLAKPAMIAENRLCEIMCKNSAGQPVDQTQQELLELLENPALGSGETIFAYDALADLAERRRDTEAAYRYRREIVMSTQEPMLAVRLAWRMQRMERSEPELKAMAEAAGPTDAWAALQRSGRVRADAQGNLKVHKLMTARPFVAPPPTATPAE